MKLYTGRRVARALRQDINFMWLSGMNTPDFRTINNFRRCRAKEIIESLFEQMLSFMIEQGHIKLENYFCDGSTFAADGNKHKMVWKKNAERYKAGLQEKCRALFAEIDALNTAEDKQYKDVDLEERGLSAKEITADAIAEQVEKLDAVITAGINKREQRKAGSLKKSWKKKRKNWRYIINK